MKTYTVRLMTAKGSTVKTKQVGAYSISHAIAEAVRGEGNVVEVSASLNVL